jgi:hypothetical protein
MKCNRSHIFLSAILLVFLNILPYPLHCQPIAVDWHSTTFHPFAIMAKNEHHPFTSIIEHALIVNYQRISGDLDYQINDIVYVYICYSESDFHELGVEHLPNWTQGAAMPATNLIIIKAYNENPNFSATAVHELTHIMLHSIIKSMNIPRWFDEGLAVYYSDDKMFASSSRVSKALIFNSIIPLSEIDRVLAFDESNAQLAYQESYLAIIFFIERFGTDSLRRLIHEMASTENIDDAFLNVIGMGTERFEMEWLNHIQANQRWQFLVDIDSYIWISILLLFAAGYFQMRRRNKKTLERWENEKDLYHD